MDITMPKSNLDALNKLIDKFNGALEEAGIAARYVVTTVAERWEEIADLLMGLAQGTCVEMVDVQVEMPAISVEHLGDIWTPVGEYGRVRNEAGTVEWARRPYYGRSLADLNTDTPDRCDHCGKRRVRSRTWVLESPKGARLQVGSTCAEGFFGANFARQLALLAELQEKLAKGVKTNLVKLSPKAEYAVEIGRFLARCVALVRTRGYVRSGLPQATRQLAWDWPAEIDQSMVSDEDTAKAQVILAWARMLPHSDDYHTDLAAAAAGTHVHCGQAGLIASAVPAYDRAQEQAATPSAAGCVGTPGDVWSGVVQCLDTRRYRSGWGSVWLGRFRDEVGHAIIVWFSGTGFNPQPGGRYVLSGRVKKHEQYRGVDQTVMSRCSLADA